MSEVRESPPCRATFGDSATGPPRASGSAGGRRRALWLSNPATALPLPHPRRRPRPAHGCLQPLARGHGAALPDPTQGRSVARVRKNCQLPEECASPVQVAD